MAILCPGCGESAFRELGAKSGITIRVCRTCSTLYSDVQAADIVCNYDDYYNASNLTVPEFIAARLDQLLFRFATYRQGGRLLDIGCGAGSLIEAAQRQGWQVEGSEVSLSAVKYLRDRGFKVHHGELPAADGVFDVVTCTEVLEHVETPESFLREIKKVLRPGGLLWVTTPNGSGLSAKVIGTQWSVVTPPEHVQLFSPKGLQCLLQRSGFREVEIECRGTNPYELLRHFGKKSDQPFDRVKTSYALNASLTSTSSGRVLKGLANGLLDFSRLGDTLSANAVC